MMPVKVWLQERETKMADVARGLAEALESLLVVDELQGPLTPETRKTIDIAEQVLDDEEFAEEWGYREY